MQINPPIELVKVFPFTSPSDKPVTPIKTSPLTEYIEIVLGGAVYFEENGTDQIFRRGTIFWHTSGEYTISRSLKNQPYRCLAILFKVKQDNWSVPRITRWQESDSALDAFADEITAAFHSENIDRNILMDYIHRRLYWSAYNYAKNRHRPGYPKVLAKAITLCRRQEYFSCGIEFLAGELNVSKSYLHALFLRHLHMSPHQYQLDYRLNIAKTMLTASGENIKTISENCGFDHIESFYRAFRKQTGLTPGEYRNKKQHLN